MTPEFSDLWLPFEAQIQGLCASNSTVPDTLARQGQTRRELIHQLFQSRTQGDPLAVEAVEAFLAVLRLYVDETSLVVQVYGLGQREAEEKALERLSADTNFLRQANKYTAAFAAWIVDSIGREQGSNQLVKSPREAPDYPVHTSQESAALLMAICDGKLGTHWQSNEQAGIRRYEKQGWPHFVQVALTEDERVGGLSITALERMTEELDADGTFAVLYVSRLLAPASPLPGRSIASDWIDLDDVMKKIGWVPRNAAHRAELRRKVWNYLRFCARANITGQRTGTYRDKDSGAEIQTQIDGPIWRFMKEERPVQPSLFPEEEVPLRVEIAVSREWTHLTTSPLLAQFLPMGELLGAIPPDQPSGAWARVLGLALSSFWRRQPRAALDGSILPTRRELLEAYVPKVAPPHEVLDGINPRRAIEYWCGALAILVKEGFVAPSDEATRSLAEIKASLPRYNWGQAWLDEKVMLRPGPCIETAVQATANHLPIPKATDLKTQKKRGRPRKTVAPIEK